LRGGTVNGRLQGQVALVTGGISSIGRASAYRLAEEGAAVAITSRLESSTAVEVKKSGGRAIHLRCHASDAEATAATADEICATFGDITILSTNAGIPSAPVPTGELSVAEFEQVVGVNLVGAFISVKHTLPAMLRADPSSIITCVRCRRSCGRGVDVQRPGHPRVNCCSRRGASQSNTGAGHPRELHPARAGRHWHPGGEASTRLRERGCPTSPHSRHRSVVADAPKGSRESWRSLPVGTPHS
jgi:hypothetical protein